MREEVDRLNVDILSECEMITHIKNRGEMILPVDAWVVVAPSTERIPELAYLERVLSLEIEFIMGEDFENAIG